MENSSVVDNSRDDINMTSQELVIKTEEPEQEMELGPCHAYIDGTGTENPDIESVSFNVENTEVMGELIKEVDSLPYVGENMNLTTSIESAGEEANITLAFPKIKTESMESTGNAANQQDLQTASVVLQVPQVYQVNIDSSIGNISANHGNCTENITDAPSDINFLNYIRDIPSNPLQGGENECEGGKRKGLASNRMKKTIGVKQSSQRTSERILKSGKLARTSNITRVEELVKTKGKCKNSKHGKHPSGRESKNTTLHKYLEQTKPYARDNLRSKQKRKSATDKNKSQTKRCKNRTSKNTNHAVQAGSKNKPDRCQNKRSDAGKSSKQFPEKGQTCNKGLVSCPYCSIEARVSISTDFKMHSKLKAHIASNHSTKIQQCGEHAKHPWVKYQCAQCNRMLHSIKRLLNHMILAHTSDNQSQQSRADLTEYKLFKCPNEGCEHGFTEEIALKSHLSYCHFTPTRKMGSPGSQVVSKIKCKRNQPSQDGQKRKIVRKSYKSDVSSENHKHSSAAKCYPECLKQAWSRIPFKCSSCDNQYRNHSDMVYHEVQRHSEKGLRLKCEFCRDEEFRNYHQLKQHMDHGIHEDPDVASIPPQASVGTSRTCSKFECRYCGQNFQSRLCLRHHVKGEHQMPGGGGGGGGGICQLCGKVFSTPNYVEKHVRAVHMNEPSYHIKKHYKCDTCKKVFKFKYALSVHIIDDHPEVISEAGVNWEESKLVEANQILQMSNSKEQLESKNELCHLCGKSYPDKRSLKLHCAKLHPTNAEFLSEYKCEICGKVSTSRPAVLNHKKLHRDERSYTCSYCFKTFNSRSNLNNHIVTHSRVKDYNCPMCPKSFGTQSSLYNHLYRYKSHGDVPKIKGYGSKSKQNDVNMCKFSGDGDRDNI